MDLLDSSQLASTGSSSSLRIWVWCPWSSASELSALGWFSSRTTSTKVRLPVIGARSISRRGPLLCCVTSIVCEDSSSPSAAMSRWCSQVAIGGSWLFLWPPHLLFLGMHHLLHNSLQEAANLSPPLGVPG